MGEPTHLFQGAYNLQGSTSEWDGIRSSNARSLQLAVRGGRVGAEFHCISVWLEPCPISVSWAM